MFRTILLAAVLGIAATPAMSDSPWRQGKTSYGVPAGAGHTLMLDGIFTEGRKSQPRTFHGFIFRPEQMPHGPASAHASIRMPTAGLRGTDRYMAPFSAAAEHVGTTRFSERFQP